MAPLAIDVDDKLFAVADAVDGDPACFRNNASVCSTSALPYATATSCVGALIAGGRANVDLTGTPFRIGPDPIFKAFGYMATGSATVRADRKDATFSGGGDFGSYGSGDVFHGGGVTPLPLVPDP